VQAGATAAQAAGGNPSRQASRMRPACHATVMHWPEDEASVAQPRHGFPAQPAHRMNVLAANPQTPDDTRLWSASLVEALPSGIPRLDPVAQLLAEEHRESALMRLVLSAALSILILALGAGLLS
jgi:hypothetical protein